MQAGALHFKGAAYVLPYSDEHYEFFQWLVSEVTAMGGEAAFVYAAQIEGVGEDKIKELFNDSRKRDYQSLGKKIDEFERRLQSIKKGGRVSDSRRLIEHFNKLLKEFDSIQRIDFFSSEEGLSLKKEIERIKRELKRLEPEAGRERPAIVLKELKDYQARTWVTREKPFVDRMASAWLIKRFIDPAATFEFTGNRDARGLGGDRVAFDMMGGEFTHSGDMCTFEVLIKSFNLSDKRLQKIAAIVHEIDMKDGKYRVPEAQGIEEVLKGIRKSSANDEGALKKGMEIFEMLYQSMG
ncbi:MAG: chromate resistance protein [Thermodesulfovibrionales bacterium]